MMKHVMVLILVLVHMATSSEAMDAECFWLRFPAYWAILSHHKEDVARKGSVRIFEMWFLDPRPEAHDDYSVKRMTNETLVSQMMMFNAGQPRWENVFELLPFID